MKRVTYILMTLMALATTACGGKSGINVTLHEKAKPTPPSVEQKALAILESNSAFAERTQSPSSNAIRAQLIGLNASFAAGSDSSTTNISITLSQKHGADTCSVRTFSGPLDNDNVQEFMEVKDLGHMMCLDKTCEFILIVIEQSANQMSTSKGLIEAAVPMILEDRLHDKKISTGDYSPSASEDASFMQLTDDENLRCNAPVEITSSVGPMLPDEYTADYSYFPLDDYNTWR